MNFLLNVAGALAAVSASRPPIVFSLNRLTGGSGSLGVETTGAPV